MKLKYEKADVKNGLTFWTVNGKTYSLPYGSGNEMERLASTDPFKVRDIYGIPDNFYVADWNEGTIEVSLGVFNYFFKEVER